MDGRLLQCKVVRPSQCYELSCWLSVELIWQNRRYSQLCDGPCYIWRIRYGNPVTRLRRCASAWGKSSRFSSSGFDQMICRLTAPASSGAIAQRSSHRQHVKEDVRCEHLLWSFLPLAYAFGLQRFRLDKLSCCVFPGPPVRSTRVKVLLSRRISCSACRTPLSCLRSMGIY